MIETKPKRDPKSASESWGERLGVALAVAAGGSGVAAIGCYFVALLCIPLGALVLLLAGAAALLRYAGLI